MTTFTYLVWKNHPTSTLSLQNEDIKQGLKKAGKRMQCVCALRAQEYVGRKEDHPEKLFFLCFLLKRVHVEREGGDKGMNYISKGFCMWKMYGKDK